LFLNIRKLGLFCAFIFAKPPLKNKVSFGFAVVFVCVLCVVGSQAKMPALGRAERAPKRVASGHGAQPAVPL